MTTTSPGATAARSAAVGAWKHGIQPFEDRVAAEDPLEIRVNGSPCAVTMRTPGDDEELAVGFVLTEGVVRDASEIQRVVVVEDVHPSSRGNVVDVRLSPSLSAARLDDVRRRTRRHVVIHSAWGVCRRATIDAVGRRLAPLGAGPRVPRSTVPMLTSRLREAQPVFAETGGLHAAGLFDLDGSLIAAREDIGRHNAVDKAVGFAALGSLLPLETCILMVSGRAGFEIVQKAWAAGIRVLASVSAPSRLAVELAEEANMTLLGFVRGEAFTLYTGRSRLAGCCPGVSR